MAEPALGRAAIEDFLEAACAGLEGEWLLVGGALAATWFAAGRVTADIDLIGLAGTMAERLQLMELAQARGLPVEAVNSAADFFLHRIPGWRDELEVLRRGPRSTLYRPTPTLFLLLKIGRLSEQDLADCLGLLSLVQKEGLALDAPRVLAALAELPATDDMRLAGRRQALQAALEQPNPSP